MTSFVDAPEFGIRVATAADLPALLKLSLDALGPSARVPRTGAFLRWKHFDNPFGESPILVAESSGALVGMRAFMRWRFRAGAQRIEGYRPVDTATHPDFRGQGIFRKLTTELVARIEGSGVSGLIFNTPNDQSMPGYLKMGWQKVGRVSIALRPRVHSLGALLSERTSAGPVPSGDLEGTLARLSVNPQCNAGIHTDHSLDTLRWRYADVPGVRYDGRTLRSTSMVYTTRLRATGRLTSGRPRQLRELTLCEVRMGEARDAWRLLSELAAEARADVVSCALPPGSRARLELIGAGLIPAPRLGPWLTVRPIGRLSVDALSPACWDASIGALELF